MTDVHIDVTLPEEFADLRPFAGWALRTEAERYDKRLSSSMDELQTFYDAAFPRLEAAIEYLDRTEATEQRDNELPWFEVTHRRGSDGR